MESPHMLEKQKERTHKLPNTFIGLGITPIIACWNLSGTLTSGPQQSLSNLFSEHSSQHGIPMECHVMFINYCN